ncbi:hypothetical protein [Devosia sp. SL43]|uniref:hypothetical protein n=1 Tax=Devosia sp. SL43 TaxID=2806348 RepID=UPI001F28C455|nr:hypothetical protein [Devosia sp. SL43]UJW86439.1 hypothetical protein IM737_04005 [Devosia sp. SL43]
MQTSTTSRRRLGALAAACLLSVALPTTAAWAQKSKTKAEPSVEAPAETPAVATAAEFSVAIPTIDAVDSNVDDETLREIFAGNVIDNAEDLAGLTATSITIPEITINATNTVDGETTTVGFVMSDLVFADVADGVAGSVSVASATFDVGEAGSGSYDAFTMSDFNIGALLGVLGLVDNVEPGEFQTIYSDFTMEGGSLSYPQIDCTLNPATAGEFKARPFNYSVPEMMQLVSTLSETETPSPETLGALLRMYADVLTAFEMSEVKYSGVDCSGTDDEGRPLTIAVGSFTMGPWTPGVYPAFSVEGVEIAVEGDGAVSLGSATFKEMDLSGPIAAIEAAPEALDEAWFVANARSLIPAFAGFSFDGLDIDVPDPETEGGRITASIGAFDLSLAEYVNGIPSDILTTGSNIVVDLPEDSDDEQVQQLLALGITSVDAGFTVDASWNEAENTISVDEVSVTGADLATVLLSGTIANATEALFATDQNEMMAAAMGIAIANLKVDVTDAGLSDIILARVAADQGGTAEQMRPVFAGLAEGTIVGMLAGAAEAQKVGGAVSSFVSGQAKQLIIELTAKEAPGLGLMDFMAAESDPTVLIGKVTIDATAK